MITIELFSGTASFSKVARELGHKTFTVDIEKRFIPNICVDIMDFKKDMLPPEFQHPDIVWASPPCQTFSVASLRYYWNHGIPKNDKTLKGIALVKKTINLISDLNPTFFFIENPRGMLRRQDFMVPIMRKTVSYCQYGDKSMKPTDVWTNLFGWHPKICRRGASCHESSPRGSHKGIEGLSCGKERSRIPPKLFHELFKIMKFSRPDL